MKRSFTNFKIMFFVIFLFGSLSLGKSSWAAENIYVAQNSTGTNSGAGCANVHSSDWFNTSNNWATPKQSGKIGPGDTVHLCGTLTSPITVQGSGTTGSPITILFESGAKFSAPYWAANTKVIDLGSYNYLTVDGGTNGIIECTDNGGALGHQTNVYGVDSYGDNITIQNLTIQNLYVRFSPIATGMDTQ